MIFFVAIYISSDYIVRQTIIHFVITVFFSCSSLSRRDPLVKVCDNIINEVVKESTVQLVRSAVDEVVVGHMAVIKSGDWLEDLILETIQPMLPRVVREFLCSVYASEVTCDCHHK